MSESSVRSTEGRVSRSKMARRAGSATRTLGDGMRRIRAADGAGNVATASANVGTWVPPQPSLQSLQRSPPFPEIGLGLVHRSTRQPLGAGAINVTGITFRSTGEFLDSRLALFSRRHRLFYQLFLQRQHYVFEQRGLGNPKGPKTARLAVG